MKKIGLSVAFLALASFVITSCSSGRKTAKDPGKRSRTTGAAYAKKEGEGFHVADFKGMPAGPNMVFIEGGRFVMGSLEEDVVYSHDNIERTVTVNSFYMDETEMSNLDYLEYLYAVSQDSTREFYEAALPDTTVWARAMSFNDQYVEQYLRYPGFREYPVVGVSWVQANDYAKWRTAVVNRELYNKYGKKGRSGGLAIFGRRNRQAEDPALGQSTGGRVPIETGIVLPDFRLPTEAEWEYAAKATIGTQTVDENYDNRIYPWSGSSMRRAKGRKRGEMMANYKRGRGDYAGIAGKLNDGYQITAPVYEYYPNDFGLYHMAGNVNEWVIDLYRPGSYRDFDDLNPIRRDDTMDAAGNYDTGGFNSLINNKVRVYKGGSWNDVAYWLAPGTRRFLDQDSSTATIGFRCAMTSIGEPGKKKL